MEELRAAVLIRNRASKIYEEVTRMLVDMVVINLSTDIAIAIQVDTWQTAFHVDNRGAGCESSRCAAVNDAAMHMLMQTK